MSEQARVRVAVENAGIRYRVGDVKAVGLKDFLMKRLRGRNDVKDFWADRGISFELRDGDLLGIIGGNGAGKSTLLKAIAGILRPKEGSIRCRGRIAALLELATGFDGQLTVKENTYLRGAMLGFSRKFMNAAYEGIVDYAGLKEFENREFRQLSSGMKSRLAFAVSSLVKPDILILDEVLSVGDGAFKVKSEAKMKELITSGAVTILVSHSIGQIRAMCNKVLWLEKGHQVEFTDDVNGCCDRYEEYLRKEAALYFFSPNGGERIAGPEVLFRRLGDRHGDVPTAVRPGHSFVAWRDADHWPWGLRREGVVKVSGWRNFIAEWKKDDPGDEYCR